MACLEASGTMPLSREKVMTLVMTGTSSSRHCFIRGFGMGSRPQLLSGDRMDSVVDDGVVSNSPSFWGVPEGSILRPVLFAPYSQSLFDITSSHGCDYHKYAADTEVLDSATTSDFLFCSIQHSNVHTFILPWIQSIKMKRN